MGKKLIYVILAICLAMAGILIAIIMSEPVANAGGIAHPQIPAMQVGGDGQARLEHIGGLAFMFQTLLLILIICLSMLGVSERYRSKDFIIYMSGTALFSLFCWWMMWSEHRQFMASGETGYFMGFPIATAWQMYGTWLGAIPLILIYSLGFRKYIYTEQDEKDFNKLLEEQNQKPEQ
jgi:hypothetical protein